MNDNDTSRSASIVTGSSVYHASGVVDRISTTISGHLWAGGWVEGELLAPFVCVVMSLNDQVYFLLDKQVEESYSHGASCVAAAYAELMGSNDHPAYSLRASIVYRVRGPVIMKVIGVVLPTSVLVGTGLAGLRTTVGRQGAYARDVVDFWSSKDETCDWIYSWIVEIVFFAVAITFDRPAHNWNTNIQRTAVDISFITVSLPKSGRMSTGIAVAGKNLDVVEFRLELTTPNSSGDRWVITETSQAQKEVRVDGLQAIQVIHRSTNGQTADVSRGAK